MKAFAFPLTLLFTAALLFFGKEARTRYVRSLAPAATEAPKPAPPTLDSLGVRELPNQYGTPFVLASTCPVPENPRPFDVVLAVDGEGYYMVHGKDPNRIRIGTERASDAFDAMSHHWISVPVWYTEARKKDE